MQDSLHKVFSRSITKGQLGVTYPSERTETYGGAPMPHDADSALAAPHLGPVAIRIADDAALKAILADPGLAIGEMYMQGRLVVEEGTIYDFISLMKRNGAMRALPARTILTHLRRSITGSVRKRAGISAARRNIAHHYDLDERLFRLFLDTDMNYSCAYFEHDDQSLEDAQTAKQRLIAGKLLSKPGGTAFDLGCGWGSMALYLTEVAGLKTTGISISEEQVRVGQARVADKGLQERCEIRLQDYRKATGTYDHVTSIGVLEHIGLPQMDAYFGKVAELLDKQGTALIHSMFRTKPATYSQPFGEKYIFPGGYIPALSEVLPAIERAGLLVKDVEILPLHYAQTCRIWRERFLANREAVLELYDEAFVRMWEIYLAASEASFRHDRIHVGHLLLARHQDRIPIRRGWLEPELDRLRRAEAARR
ncbi:SAM-dependent methyltransferase [Oceanibium sediminis]|uniref:SAM-dependent methyltransferase n=1 Tax=Oceanibium sediminis TaxID=2026339 RepID=UPI000DD4E606|nr:cyclopropane-fatty-acyl-phospholipid synthase family protein [Oceanibium sediminis]